jgi:hypothetical protein
MSNTTNIAKLFVGPDGKPVIQSWSQWSPTVELRFWIPSHTHKPVLQQRFLRHGYDSVGHVTGGEFEWRTVPTEAE